MFRPLRSKRSPLFGTPPPLQEARGSSIPAGSAPGGSKRVRPHGASAWPSRASSPASDRLLPHGPTTLSEERSSLHTPGQHRTAMEFTANRRVAIPADDSFDTSTWDPCETARCVARPGCSQLPGVSRRGVDRGAHRLRPHHRALHQRVRDRRGARGSRVLPRPCAPARAAPGSTLRATIALRRSHARRTREAAGDARGAPAYPLPTVRIQGPCRACNPSHAAPRARSTVRRRSLPNAWRSVYPSRARGLGRRGSTYRHRGDRGSARARRTSRGRPTVPVGPRRGGHRS